MIFNWFVTLSIFIVCSPLWSSPNCRDLFQDISPDLLTKTQFALFESLKDQSYDTSLDPVFLKTANLLEANLGENFRVLAFHPGILSRAEKFINFVKNRELPNNSVIDHFYAYKKFLGTINMWRALLLNASEFENVKDNGLEPNMLRNGFSDKDILLRIASHSLNHFIRSHMNHAGAKSSPFQSFTEVSEIAEWVTNNGDTSSRSRYTFLANVDVLDIVYVSHSGPIQEALVFGFLPPSRIVNLSYIQPMNERTETYDIINALSGLTRYPSLSAEQLPQKQ